MKKFIQFTLVSVISILLMSTTCEYDTSPYFDSYPFYNDTDDTIYIYERLYDDQTDTLKSSEAIKDYKWIVEVKPGGETTLGVIADDVPDGDPRNSQIMVFERRTFEEHTLNEIIDQNIYDHLYIYLWTQIKTPGFEIRYTSDTSDHHDKQQSL